MHYSEKLKNTRVLQNGQKTILNAVRSTFPETNEFIDSTLKEECEKERMTADEVIFYKFKSKKLAWINIFVSDLVL